MFGAGAPLMGAGGQGFDPRRMMGGPQAGNTPGQNPFGRGSSGGADQFGIGGGPGGGPGGSAMASGGAPPWQQPPGGGMPPGLQGGPMGAGGPSPYQAQMGGGMNGGQFSGGPMGGINFGAAQDQFNRAFPQGGQGMAGGNMGPGGSGGIFAGGGGAQWGGPLDPNFRKDPTQRAPGFGEMGGSLGNMTGQPDGHGGFYGGKPLDQLGMNVQGGNMGPKPMSPIGAGAYGQAGGNMGGQIGGGLDGQGQNSPGWGATAGGGVVDQRTGRPMVPPGHGGPTGSMANMESRLARAGMPPEQIQRRLQMAQEGKLPWQQAQGGQGAGGRETQAFNSQNNTEGGHTGTPLSPPSQGHPPGGLRQPPGRPAPPPTRGTNSGLNTQGSNPFGRGSSGGAGAFAVDDGSNGGGPSSAGEAGSTSRLDVIGGRGAAVRPRNPGPGGGGPAPPRGGIADGRPTPRPMKPGISAPGGMSGGEQTSRLSDEMGNVLRGAGKPAAGVEQKRQSMAGKAFGKLKA